MTKFFEQTFTHPTHNIFISLTNSGKSEPWCVRTWAGPEFFKVQFFPSKKQALHSVKATLGKEE